MQGSEHRAIDGLVTTVAPFHQPVQAAQPALDCASLTAPERSKRLQTPAHALRSCTQGYTRVTRAVGALQHYLDKTPHIPVAVGRHGHHLSVVTLPW
jgi:hypothetical protein